MTDTEFSKLAMFIKSLYPKDKEVFNDDTTLEIWFSMLSDLDFKDAVKAVQLHAKKEKFLPTIAEIREYCDKAYQTDWQEAYENAIRIIARYGSWNEEAGMNALDDVSRQAVRRIGYKRICISPEHDPYIRKEFKEAYTDIEQMQRLEQMGADVKCLN